MKKLSILLAGILLLPAVLILSGCSSNNSISPAYVTVTSFDRNVSISVPSAWNTNETGLAPGSIIAVGDEANQAYLVITEAPKTSLGTNSTIDNYMAQIKAAFVPIVPDAVWGNSSSVVVGGFQGLTALASGTWKSNSTTFFVYALASYNYYYTIVGITNTSLVNTNKEALQTIVNSFKAPITTSSDSWFPYSFPISFIIAIILLIAGIGLIFLGRRLKNRVKVPHPGKLLKIALIVIWVVSLLIFLSIITILARRSNGAGDTGLGPIFPITLAYAVCSFIYLAFISRHDGFLTALGNGFVGFAAGPMIFEFPFDLIIIPQVKASIIFRIEYFIALDVAVLLTLSLLLLSKRVYITRYSMYSLGAMFIIFAVWAWFGFSYPSTPISYVLNAISKVLAFVTVIALFSTDPKQIPQGEIKNPKEDKISSE